MAAEVLLQCGYYDAGRCRSCTLLETPYAEQLARKQAHADGALKSAEAHPDWSPAHASRPSTFRNKAKLVVGGRAGAVTLGILDGDQRGVDLRACGLYEPALSAVIPVLADLVDAWGLEPYDVPSRRGELKFLLITCAPDGGLLVRFVLRTEKHLPILRDHLPTLRSALPQIQVVTANLHPEHKAVLEGEREVVLTEAVTLPMSLGDLRLHLGPRSFFQTNTTVAAALYDRARAWTAAGDATTVWDLFCGVGGFALHLAAPGRSVTGVELSEAAVAAAQRSAAEFAQAHPDRVVGGGLEFVVDDATAYASRNAPPDLIVVNPPRRGLTELADLVEASGITSVLYSSCNTESLVRDLGGMPSYAATRAQVFDMFPQTSHYELLVMLERRHLRWRPAERNSRLNHPAFGQPEEITPDSQGVPCSTRPPTPLRKR